METEIAELPAPHTTIRQKCHAIVTALLIKIQRWDGHDRDYACEFGEHTPECRHGEPWIVIEWLFWLEQKLKPK